MARTKQQLPDKSPNEGLDLAQFDYENLKGESFQRYLEVVQSLSLNQKYDWEVWNAKAVYKFRMNEDTGAQEKFMHGIELLGNKPIMHTRVDAFKITGAQGLNMQVSDAADAAKNSKYYLLTKPQNDAKQGN